MFFYKSLSLFLFVLFSLSNASFKTNAKWKKFTSSLKLRFENDEAESKAY